MTTPKARFGGVDVVSKNMEASLAFYREIGLDIAEDKVYRNDGGAQHVDLQWTAEFGLDIDSEALTVGYDPAWAASAAKGAAVMITFRTDSRADVDALHDHMVALGHPSHMAPIDAFWGARFAILVDPDGNHVTLMSPMDAAMSSPPEDSP